MRFTPCVTQTQQKAVHTMPPLDDTIGAALNDVSGTAALAICESLLLALNDRKVLPKAEILGILEDAAAAHVNVSDDDPKVALHMAVAALIHGILDGGNSVRHL